LGKASHLSRLFLYLPAVTLIGSSISYGDIYLYHFYAWFLTFLLLINVKTLKEIIGYNLKNNKIWLLIFTYTTLSLTWTKNLSDGFKYLGYLYCGYFLIFNIPFFIDSSKKKNFVFNSLFYVFIAHLIICLLEILTPFRWPLSQYSSLLPYFNRTLTPGFEDFVGYPTGLFWHQNNSALTTLMCIPFLFKIERKWLRYTTLVASYLTILASGSKAMIVLSAVHALFILFQSKKIQIKTELIAPGIVLMILAFTLLVLSNQQKNEIIQTYETVGGYGKPLPQFLMTQFTGEEFDYLKLHANIAERFYFMAGGIELYKTNPILGSGAGSHFTYLFHKNGTSFVIKAIHNFYIELLALFGPIILGLYIYWFSQKIWEAREFRQSLILFALGIPVLSTAAYFLPGWLLIAFSEIRNGEPE
jgi:hypothetical protein